MEIAATSVPGEALARSTSSAPGGERPVSHPIAAKPSAAPPPQHKPSADELAAAVSRMQQAAGLRTRNLQFSIDQQSDEIVVKVVDARTKEVIRQIPSEEALRLAHSFDEKQGLLIEQKA